MRPGNIEQSDVQRDSVVLQVFAYSPWHFAEAGRNLQQGKMIQLGRAGDSLDHALRRCNSAEPAVDAAYHTEGGLCVAKRAAIGIENFGGVDSLHGQVVPTV